MWIVYVLLVLVGWTGLGLAVALVFFRLGFGFDAGRRPAEHALPPRDPFRTASRARAQRRSRSRSRSRDRVRAAG
jgi:hypothetical protein